MRSRSELPCGLNTKFKDHTFSTQKSFIGGFRLPACLLQAFGAVVVLFLLSWRLGPILAGVIFATGFTATLYKNQTKSVENENASATNEMNNIANQAFDAITTVR